MEMDVPDGSNESTPRTEENGSLMRPVLPEESGVGLPYAPVNWPNPGDMWGWRVGRRVASTGHYLDRYLYLPRRLYHVRCSMNRKHAFASKLSVERFIRTEFPGADIDAFFASFSWKIPAKKSALTNGHEDGLSLSTVPFDWIAEYEESDSQTNTVGCKAGNKMCNSILKQVYNPPLAAMHCDLCCSEPRFCQDCCCILCSKTVSLDNGGYSYIKCEAVAAEGYICGHIAHIDCALRCYMAGTVGGSIGLDAEYYCRRCDARTNLMSHATRLLQTCESIHSRDDIEKILSVGVNILRGSRKTSAKRLLHRFEMAILKLKNGTSVEDIWKVEDNFLVMSAVISLSLSLISLGHLCSPAGDDSQHENAAPTVPNNEETYNVTKSSEHTLPVRVDPWTESLKLEDEIDHVLLKLKKSQESEYKIAEETLHAQKNYLLSLYQQLENEKSELSFCKSSDDTDCFPGCISNRVQQINRELEKLKDMGKVANGFGKTSKGILKDHFGLETEN